MTPQLDPIRIKLTEAALPHVAFDGWSYAAFKAAAADADMTLEEARAACPRGAVDLAVTFHKMGDAAMMTAMEEADLSDMRYRDKVAHAIRLRLDAVEDKEAVRRGSTLFSLPHMAPEGSALIWGTADAIWRSLGDSSDDINWYTKRATLSAVYGSVVLFWLGDDSVDGQATVDFIDRRIDNVMQFEKVKAAVSSNPVTKPFASLLGSLTSGIKAPKSDRSDLPGSWVSPRG
ncbi:MAG: COQ9 family protein [Pseudomonadota bacterium]